MSMRMIEKPLTVNAFTRSGRPLAGVKAVILHWTGVPMQRALSTWNFFEKTCPAEKHYSSAHYIVDINGDIYHAIPDGEVAYHCGSFQPDPVSGRVYTDWAREKTGRFAENPDINSPNNCTPGIEMCVVDAAGNFSPETLEATGELTAKLLRDDRLTINDIGTHHLMVGWKDCPRLWTRYPDRFDIFRQTVKERMRGLA